MIRGSLIGAANGIIECISKVYPRFEGAKVDFAKLVAECVSVDDLEILDLRKKIEALRLTILKWNSYERSSEIEDQDAVKQ